jgi:hypothetical protein
LNRFQATVLSRSKAGNAIARAAYNARTRLKDDRTGDLKDYSRKGGLEFEGIFAPKDAPAWAKNREMPWNEVEKREDQSKHRDRLTLSKTLRSR